MDIIINIAVFLISAVIFTFVGFFIRKKIAESKMKSAENEAKRILELANKEAENKKKEEIFKAKEEIMKAKDDLEKEVRERRGEVQLQEKRLMQKEENLENKINMLEKKEKDLTLKMEQTDSKKQELDSLYEKEIQELQKISRLSVEDAKKQLLTEVEKQITVEKANLIKDLDQKAKETADKNAREIIGYAIQKYAADHSQETTPEAVVIS